MTAPSDSWTSFTLKADLKASVPDLYRAWTTQKGLESWFLRMAEFNRNGKILSQDEEAKAGDNYHWLWHGYPDEVNEKRQVLAANGKDNFRFKFSGDCTVDVSFREEGETNIVELVQSDIPTESDPNSNLYVQCSIGWTFYLANLKSVMEGGIDLRNSKMDLDSTFK